ncbi:MAG: group II intron reverse transcriptase/maturase [Firmicutes bacterium]|nr:group II intron reverse transcriptase/maturase [Bacillota bacterium]MBR3375913.1 group II intron reverse transcriptase/maturase [Bacillota bacterium]
METKLERITQLSKENPEMVFTSIGHLINTDMLRDCHREMDGKKAVGIDGVTKDDYEENLEENLTDLMDRMKRKAYHPKPARRVEIPKDNGKTRPLSIYCYEDKLVQEALRRVLEAVFEPQFYDEMMGFRPNRGCHEALRLLNYQLVREKTSWLIDADIKGFFDNIDHDWMMKFVGARIKDPRVLRLVRVMLKAGVVKDMGGFEPTEQGSGQGSVCSPILANIYMHYVLLWWFHERVLPTLKGYAGIVNYADDFVVCFQYKWEAERFYERLKRRMANFGLSLAEDKCRLIEFGRFAISNRRDRGEGKPETFDFLGFTHICSKSKNGGFRVRRKTSRKKLAKKGKEMHHKIGMMRAEKTANIIKWVNQVLVGYYRYYGVYGNYPSVMQFRWNVLKSLYYWLNRRSQTKSYTYEGFSHMIDKGHPIARPKAYYVYI